MGVFQQNMATGISALVKERIALVILSKVNLIPMDILRQKTPIYRKISREIVFFLIIKKSFEKDRTKIKSEKLSETWEFSNKIWRTEFPT